MLFLLLLPCVVRIFLSLCFLNRLSTIFCGFIYSLSLPCYATGQFLSVQHSWFYFTGLTARPSPTSLWRLRRAWIIHAFAVDAVIRYFIIIINQFSTSERNSVSRQTCKVYSHRFFVFAKYPMWTWQNRLLWSFPKLSLISTVVYRFVFSL